MSSQWRERLLAEHRAEVDSWWSQLANSAPPSDAELEQARRENWLEAARHLDPSASLAEELQVRLSGDAQRGALSTSLGDVLLRPLNNAVVANARTAPERRLELELLGLSAGSTVLHFGVRPSLAQIDTEGDTSPALPTPVDGSVADAVMTRTLEAVKAAEDERQDFGPWHAALDPLEKLGTVLDDNQLAMELTWLAKSGAVRAARLTTRGISHLRFLTQTHPQERSRTVSGRVTELKESGLVKLKAGENRNSTAYEIKIDQTKLHELRLFLGAWETFVVTETQQFDRGTNLVGTTYAFIQRGVADAEDVMLEEHSGPPTEGSSTPHSPRGQEPTDSRP